MDAVPATMPVTIPDSEPTVAFELPELQRPPADASSNVVVSNSQTLVVPAIVAGNGLTVTEVVVKQVVGN